MVYYSYNVELIQDDSLGINSCALSSTTLITEGNYYVCFKNLDYQSEDFFLQLTIQVEHIQLVTFGGYALKYICTEDLNSRPFFCQQLMVLNECLCAEVKVEGG